MQKGKIHLTNHELYTKDLGFASIAIVAWSTERSEGVCGVTKFADGKYILWTNEGGKTNAKGGTVDVRRGAKQLLFRLMDFTD